MTPKSKRQTSSEQESGTTPAIRRRQHHIRSKKGCVTCKERHIRCDERMPFCRNCVRVGRVCTYAASSTSSSRNQTPDPTSPSPSRVTTLDSDGLLNVPGQTGQQDWPAYDANYPMQYQEGSNSIALSVVQQSYQISRGSAIPQWIPSMIADDCTFADNDRGGIHECIKYALVSFDAYIHDQATRTPMSGELYLSQACIAINKLQNEINRFSEENSDAIVTASIILAETAQDWEQWMVFIEGCAKALTHIRQNELPTMYPELLGSHFILHNYSTQENACELPHPGCQNEMHQQVNSVLTFIQATAAILSPEQYRTAGFGDLEQLALTVREVISLTSSGGEIFHRLAWLRSWMFWIELRKPNDKVEGQVLACYFYALVAAIVPLYPSRYQAGLPGICSGRMHTFIEDLGRETVTKYGLVELVDMAKVGWRRFE
ncbi:hypothetical protein BJ875DRAFT_469445 [Amylocarpus encephaloides]|uniref:Zn(2)-C6 fungal-type domain-containing protein n=1 Tax=Amylocarpus encephaloides TaxID=45428 RepID=A0A9P8C2V5_9HELO|nr:hypothetical protein BJ875DRAFT_469445 [Amylocarpus encephaloides]